VSEWREVALGEVAEIAVGPAFKSAEFTENTSDVRLLRGVNVGVGEISWSATKYWPSDRAADFARYRVEVGDVILAMDRPWIDAGLKVAAARSGDVPSLLVQRVARLRARGDVHQPFLRAVVATNQFAEYLKRVTSGTAVPHISARDIQRFSLQVPSAATQRRIAAVLSAFDELVEINERRIELLEDLARSLYREWFVRFRFPGHAAVDLVDSDLGLIPGGWRATAVGELAETVVDGANADELDPEDPYIGLEHLPRRRTTLREWGGSESITSRKVRFRRGDTLFGKIRPYFHKVVWAPFDGAASSDTIVLRSIGEPNSALMNSILSSDGLVAVAVATSNGTKMPRANPEALLAHSLALPAPGSEPLLQFGRAVGAWLDSAASLVAYNRRLAATRDLLLPRLVTGRLDMSHIDLGELLPSEAA
jgi:type I restriction enzyme S subunit